MSSLDWSDICHFTGGSLF